MRCTGSGNSNDGSSALGGHDEDSNTFSCENTESVTFNAAAMDASCRSRTAGSTEGVGHTKRALPARPARGTFGRSASSLSTFSESVAHLRNAASAPMSRAKPSHAASNAAALTWLAASFAGAHEGQYQLPCGTLGSMGRRQYVW